MPGMGTQSRPRCYLGMPGYGNIAAGAARSFYRATAGGIAVRREFAEGSLLAKNMNTLWCGALNDAKENGLEYFAMQHSDVQVEDFWLDSLIAELEARQLDVLGVVVPIKDQNGLTSTALGVKDAAGWRLDGDVWCEDGTQWRPHARLTMAEVYRLPETFTSEDVGYPLLLNTGLWVCRFNLDWARKVFFTVNDRIVLDPDGRFQVQDEPEDWFVSRLFHALGLRIGCTRKIAVAHHGHMNFANTHPWGAWSHDEQALPESPIPRASWFPHDVAGWLTEGEGEELAALAEGKAVLEIGSYCGRSTVCLGQSAKAVYAVDTFDGRGTALPGDTLETFNRNIRRYDLTGRVYPLKGSAAEIVPTLPPIFDAVFIDGSHDYESVKQDIELSLTVLRPGGLLAFHDYGKPEDPGVTRAVDELVAGGADLLRRRDSLAVIRPSPAEVSVGS